MNFIPRYGAFFDLCNPLSTRIPTVTLGDLHGFEAPSLRFSQRLCTRATHVVCRCGCVIHARAYPRTMRVRSDTRICTPAHIYTPFILSSIHTSSVTSVIGFLGETRKFCNACVAPKKTQENSVTHALRLKKHRVYPPPTPRNTVTEFINGPSLESEMHDGKSYA